MRPAISRLVHPIYPELRDHPSVKGRPSVMAMASNVHFITHSHPEVRARAPHYAAHLLTQRSSVLNAVMLTTLSL